MAGDEWLRLEESFCFLRDVNKNDDFIYFFCNKIFAERAIILFLGLSVNSKIHSVQGVCIWVEVRKWHNSERIDAFIV